MKVMEKLKTIKRKWIYLTAALIVVVVAGGITAEALHERFDGRNDEHERINSYQTYTDLLYLENTNDLKLTSAQAKALAPLVEKLSTATDKTAVSDLEKNIYTQLTPQQYYALLNGSNNGPNGKYWEIYGRHKGESEGRFESGDGEDDVRGMSDTIKDVVLKMLNDISSK